MKYTPRDQALNERIMLDVEKKNDYSMYIKTFLASATPEQTLDILLSIRVYLGKMDREDARKLLYSAKL